MASPTNATATQSLRILELIAENVKRIEVVEIRPNGNLVQITGRNGAGKSSVLDAIWWALAGTSHIQAEPIRRGAKEARIRLDLGEMIVTRSFKSGEAGMATSLSVQTPEGAEYRRPQQLIDSFFNALSFDPLAFTRMDARAQFATLRAFAPDVDLEAVEAENAQDYAARRDLNAEAKRARALADKLITAHDADLPTEPIDTGAIEQELADAGLHNGEIDARKARRDRAQAQADNASARALDLGAQAQRLRDEAAAAILEAERLEAQAADFASEAQGLVDRLAEAPALPDPIYPSEIRERLNRARTINSLIDVARQRAAAAADAERLETEAKAITARMEARSADARKQIGAAKMPIDTLALTPEGSVMLAGMPFDQASDAEQLRASIAIAIALNPRLKVIRVRDGSLLDPDGMQLLAEMAKAHDCQIWIERVTAGEPIGFELVAGRLRQPAAAAQ